MKTITKTALLIIISILFFETYCFADPTIGTPGPAGVCNPSYPLLPNDMKSNLLDVVQQATETGISNDTRYGYVVEAEKLDASYLKLSIWSDSSRNNLLCCELVRFANGGISNYDNASPVVNFTAAANGTLTGTTYQIVDFGGSTSAVQAVPNIGYMFVNWTGDGGFVTSTTNPLTVTNVTTVQNIKANFAIMTDPYAGSIVESTPGTYTHTFTSNATVTLNYLNGAGGGGGDWEGDVDGSSGDKSSIVYDGVTIATANGGGGGGGTLNQYNGTPGTASNSITGATNTTGGGNPGGISDLSGGTGGNGGSVTGGSFNVLAGKSISVFLGAAGNQAGFPGVDASVSLSWQ